MQITDYPKTSELVENNVFLIDGPEGTKTIGALDAILAALHELSPENHKRVFRGKSLGNTVTYEQLVAIQNGTFKDIWLGDYWEINGVKWRVADFDYWKGTGDTTFTNHHLVIVPDTHLYTYKMNDSATTGGAYLGSKLYASGLASAKTTIKNAFSGSLLTRRSFFNNTVDTGVATAGAWCDSQVDLMNELMMFGSYIHTGCGVEAKRYTTDKTQLALFQVAPQYMLSGTTCWLRDVASAKAFAAIGYQGTAKPEIATTEGGVRPVFAIG